MITDAQLKIMRLRKNAAINTLRFFKKIVAVKSSNTFNHFNRSTNDENQRLSRYRLNHPFSVIGRAEYATLNGVGNCGEKMAICYSSLSRNPTISNNSSVTMCSTFCGDHGIVLISDNTIGNCQLVSLNKLNKMTMIVDGWTEDWYFPNLDLITTYTNNIGNIPNPWQLSIRNKVKHSAFLKIKEA